MNLLKLLFVPLFFLLSNLSYAAHLSLKEKIGQMLIMGFDGQTIDEKSSIAKAIDNYNLGGVILFDYNSKLSQFGKNIDNPRQVKLLNQQLQSVTKIANERHGREDLPLFISVDYEGGKVTRLKEEYGFPPTKSAKEIGKMPINEAEKQATLMAKTLKEHGFNLNFAPVLDVEVNPDNPIIAQRERSFSNDPATVATYAQLFSQQFLSEGVECAYKHFPGHGSSTGDSHLGFVDVTDTWQEQELLPYQELLSRPNHCGIIMSAHIVNRHLDVTGLPATLSQTILTGILRHELQFDGVIITDDLQMKAITDRYGLENAVTMAINAGADLLIFGNQLGDKEQNAQDIIQLIEKKVEQGEISQERIDDAYQHIRRLKNKLKRVN
jgi:beta-N-acetylhexosaminidase